MPSQFELPDLVSFTASILDRLNALVLSLELPLAQLSLTYCKPICDDILMATVEYLNQVKGTHSLIPSPYLINNPIKEGTSDWAQRMATALEHLRSLRIAFSIVRESRDRLTRHVQTIQTVPVLTRFIEASLEAIPDGELPDSDDLLLSFGYYDLAARDEARALEILRTAYPAKIQYYIMDLERKQSNGVADMTEAYGSILRLCLQRSA